MLEAGRLHGTWRMVGRVAKDLTGVIVPPQDGAARWHSINMGLLTFSQQGRVMSVLCDGSPSTSGARREYSSECGSFRFEDGVLTMLIDAGPPEKVGHEQIRRVRFDGEILVLMPPPIEADGTKMQREIHWRRISKESA